MAEKERAVFTNMCMVYDGKGNILVQDRNDPSWPGIVFPGGHVRPGESFVESVIREVWEETGLKIKSPRLCGLKQFQTEDGARYVVALFKTDKFSGQLRASNEGEVFWIKRSDLDKYKTVPDFDELVKVFEDESLNECYYEGKDEDSWGLRLL